MSHVARPLTWQDQLDVHAMYSPIHQGYPLLFSVRGSAEGMTRQVVTSCVVEEVSVAEMRPPMPIVLDEIAAQELINQLWNSGLRPTEARAGDQVLKAKDAHIRDLRTLLEIRPEGTP